MWMISLWGMMGDPSAEGKTTTPNREYLEGSQIQELCRLLLVPVQDMSLLISEMIMFQFVVI